MIRLSGREFETVVDYCNHEDYANARVVIPKRYKLSGEDIEAIRLTVTETKRPQEDTTSIISSWMKS